MQPLKTIAPVLGLVLSLALLTGCSNYRTAQGEDFHTSLTADADETVQRFRETDASMQPFFNTAAGYAVFPKVSKGAAGIGGAHGHGVLYQNGAVVGYTELSQATIGAQLGGQTYSEIIFFENDASLTMFKSSDLEFAAQATVIAAESGAGANADFDDGVAVFTLPRGGLMFEASIGGQKFEYRPATIDDLAAAE